MAVRDSFVAVTDGDQLNDGYFNGMRTSLIDTSAGHDHDGTDSKRVDAGWIWVATEDRTVSNLDSTGFTWGSLATHRIWRITFWAHPVYTSPTASSEYVGLRINGDSGANKYKTHAIAGAGFEVISTTNFRMGGIYVEDNTNNRGGTCGTYIITNRQGENADDSDTECTPISGISGGFGGVAGSQTVYLGGYYDEEDNIDSFTIFSENNKALTGVWVLEYLKEGDE